MFHRSAIAVLVLTSACLAHPVPDAHPHRGHKWVRSHPYTVMGLVRAVPNPFDIEQYRQAGFNALLAWEPGSFDHVLPMAAAAGMPFHVHLERWGEEVAGGPNPTEQKLREGLRKLDSPENRAKIKRIIQHSGCIGFLPNDEISGAHYLRYTRHLLAWLRQLHPEAIAYGNMHPAGHESENVAYGSVDRYFDEFAAMVEPDILMTDVYPLGHPDGISYNYFKLLAAVRKAALHHGMPYWMFIQSFETTGSWTRRLPSESDIRVQMFAPLTYGYTGILYFTYDMAYERGLIEGTGEPNALYHAAAKANPEVIHVGAAMRFLTSTDVRYVPGRHAEGNATVTNKMPRDTKAWTPGAGDDDRITGISVDDVGEGKDALIGFFRDDRGLRYFMVTNVWHGANASAEDRALPITVEFAPGVGRLYRLDRVTGREVEVPLDGGTLRTTLPGGTGDLYKYTSEPFPGV